MDLSTLQVFAQGDAPAPVYAPASVLLRTGNVLAFDQSFTATGWVHLGSQPGKVEIYDSGTIATAKGTKRGGEQDLDRAQELFREAAQVIYRCSPATVLYEVPPKGAGVRHPEVSLLCALAIRLAASDGTPYEAALSGSGYEVASYHAKTGKKLVTGNANADKKAAHAAMAEHFGWITGYAKHTTNEAKRDALLVALSHLSRKD